MRSNHTPPSPVRGKSILVKLNRRSDSSPEKTNAWFMINETTNGPKISEIFRGLDKQFPAHTGTNCVFLGSHLYDIGGRGTTRDTYTEISNQIRRLNTKNLDSGWKCETLPFYCSDATATVYGNFIYLLPYASPFGLRPKSESYWAWACMYDTIEHKAFKLEPPENCYFTEAPFCFPLEGHGGVLVPIEVKGGDMELYVHEPYGGKWKPYLDQKSGVVPKIHNMQHVVSDGKFYVYKKNGDLDVYEISNWKFIGTFELPEIDYLDMMDGWNVFMVAVADSEICFLWLEEIDVDKSILHYAKVSVNVKSLEATLLEEAEFRVNACELVNCLSCDSFLDEEEGLKNEVMILRERCIYLEEELRRIKKESPRVHKKAKRSS